MQAIGTRTWILVVALPLALSHPATAIEFSDFALSADGRNAYVGASDGFVTQVDLSTGSATGRVRVGRGRTLLVADPNADRFHAIAPYSCGLLTFDGSSLDLQSYVPGAMRAPLDLLRAPSGSLVTVDSDYLEFLDVERGRQLALQRRPYQGIFSYFVDPYLLIPYGDTITVFDTRSGSTRASIAVPKGTFAPAGPLAADVGFVPEGRKLLAIDSQRKVVAAYAIPPESRSVVAAPDAGRVFVGSASCWGSACGVRVGVVSAIDIDSGQTLASIELPFQAEVLLPSPDGSVLIAVHPYDRLLTVLDARDLVVAATIELPVKADSKSRRMQVAFAPNGDLYAMTDEELFRVAAADFAVERLFDVSVAVDSVEENETPDAEQIAALVSRQRAYAAHLDGRISVVDGVELTGVYDFGEILEGQLEFIDASRDGRRLLVAVATGHPERRSTVLLLDASNLAVEAMVELEGSVRSAVFGTDDAIVYLGLWPNDELVAIDAASGQEIGRAAIDDTTGMAVDDSGLLYLVGRNSIATLAVVTPETLQVERSVDLYGTRARVPLAAADDGLYVGLWGGASYDLPQIGFVDTTRLEVVARSAVPESVTRFVPDGSGRTYLEGNACWTHVERTSSGTLHVETRPIGGPATNLAVGPERGIVYSVPGTRDALVLRAADTGGILAKIPVGSEVSALVVRDRPGLPPRATHSPTATSTPLPTATPTPSPIPTNPPALLRMVSASAVAGDEAVLQVVLETRGNEVAGIQNALLFDAMSLTPLACTVDPSLEKDLTAFRIEEDEIVAIVAGFNVQPIADGSVLYTCRFRIDATAPEGPQPLRIRKAVASSPSGRNLSVTVIDGTVDVRPGASVAPQEQSESLAGPAPSAGGCAVGPAANAGNRAWILFLAWLPAFVFARLRERRCGAGSNGLRRLPSRLRAS